MVIDLVAVRDAILSAAGVTAALAVLWRFWGKPVQTWFLDMEAKKEQRLTGIEEMLRSITVRINREFENGVPPDDEDYVPLRKAFEQHIVWSREMVDRFDRHVADGE